jgi:hypothetical protein
MKKVMPYLCALVHYWALPRFIINVIAGYRSQNVDATVVYLGVNVTNLFLIED